MKRFKQFSTVLLASLLVACSMNIPSPVGQTAQGPQMRDLIQPAYIEREEQVPTRLASNQANPQPKTVTFPDMVKKTPVQDAEPSEAPELEEALAALEQDEADFSIATHRHPRFFAASFKTNAHPRSKYQIKIPSNGSFNLVLEEASQFKIVDQDATDGEAKIQMPASTLKTFLHLKGKWRRPAKLEIEDPLYHMKDSIASARRWGKSLSLGLRPLPVPTEWQSDFGNQLVFKMTTQDVKDFAMIWLRSNKTAAFPPGIKEIGPEGGTIELPGVATLELQPGALKESMVVSMKQITDLEFNIPLFEGYKTVIGPAIRIQPEGLKSEDGQPLAVIELNVDESRFKNGESSTALRYIGKHGNNQSPENPDAWENLARVITPESHNGYFPTYNGPHVTDRFTEIAALADNYALKEFSTSQQSSTTPCHPQRYEQRFKEIFVLCNSGKEENYRQVIDQAAETAYQYIKTYQTSPLPVGDYDLFDFNSKSYKYLTQIAFAKGLSPKLVGNIEAKTYHPLSGRNDSYSIYINPESSNSVIDKAIDTTMHEIYHTFQAQHAPDTFESLFATDETAWLLESNARYMGTRIFYDNFDSFKAVVSKKDKNQQLYGQSFLPYGDSLENGIKNLTSTVRGTNTARSLYTFPIAALAPNAVEEEGRYSYVNVAAHIGNRLGIQEIINIDRKYIGAPNHSAKHAVWLLSETPDGSDFFLRFVDATILKQYGMGTDDINLVESVEGSLPDERLFFTPVTQVQKLLSSMRGLTPFERTLGNFSFQMWRTKNSSVTSVSHKRNLKVTLFEGQVKRKGRMLEENAAAKEILKNTYLLTLDGGFDFKESIPKVTHRAKFSFNTKINKFEAVVPMPNSINQQILLLVTNPHPKLPSGTSNDAEYTVNFRFNLSGITKASRPLLPSEDPTGYNSRMAVLAQHTDCEANECFVYFEHEQGYVSRAPVEKVIDKGVNVDGIPEEELIVQVTNNSLHGGKVSIEENGLRSNELENAIDTCNMLPSGTTFRTVADNVPDKLKPCLAKGTK